MRFHFKQPSVATMCYKYFTCAFLLFLLPVSLSAAEIENDKVPDIPCDKDWFLFSEKCYKVFGKRTRWLNWLQAKEKCAEEGGHLATVYSKEVKDFLLVFLLMDLDYTSWIGLNDIENEGSYVWDDGTPYQFSAWNRNEPSGTRSEKEDCVEMVLRVPVGERGEWNDHDCSSNRIPYICQVDKGKQGRSTPDPLICSSPGGLGRKYRNSCYNIVNERMTWDDAEKHCQDKYKGHLVMILDEKVDYFVEYILKGYNMDIWIGIKTKNQFQQQYSSGWYAAYTNWRDNPRNIYKDTCVVRGKDKVWERVPCTEKYSFICEVSTVSAPVLNNPGDHYKCPKVPDYRMEDWRDLGGEFCYFFDKSNHFTWDQASSECIKRGGHLASIHSQVETDLLAPFTETLRFAGSLERRFFIGLHRPQYNENIFVWSDGSRMDFTNWDVRQPDNKHEKCGEMLPRTTKWNDVICDQPKGYICSARKIHLHSPDTQNSVYCENGWSQFRDKCYKIEGHRNLQNQVAWVKASVICTQKGGSLASIHSKEENDFIATLLSGEDAYIGLNKETDFNFIWDDRYPLDYKNWMFQQPDNYGGIEHCVEMKTSGSSDTVGQWNDIDCRIKMPYVCQKNSVS